MGERDRKYADDILVNSTDKATGKLDLKLLDKETTSIAKHLAQQDNSYESHPADVIAMYKVRVIHAINEVMGLIPKDKWTHDSDDLSTIEQFGHWITNAKDKEPELHNKLKAHIENPKLLDPDKTLSEQHVTAEVPNVPNNKAGKTTAHR